MKAAQFFRYGMALMLAAAAVAAARPAVAQEIISQTTLQAACAGPADLVRLDYSLKRVSQKILAHEPLTIVAIGSSSTFGAGASSPELSYPSRLAVELQALVPDSPITVYNRGVNGETAPDMLARFDRDVFSVNPDLVIWQVGSNSVLLERPIAPAATLIQDGLSRLKTAGADVILINPQYAPKVIAKHDADLMVDLIAGAAKENSVNLFQRYALMRYWRLTEDVPFGKFVSKDELHMNDWSYGCVAKLLAGAIQDVVMRATVTATARPPRR
jgi:acyl-CoA thioesterase-1